MGPYPLTGLGSIRLRLKHIIVGVVVLSELIPQDIEWLQDRHTSEVRQTHGRIDRQTDILIARFKERHSYSDRQIDRYIHTYIHGT